MDKIKLLNEDKGKSEGRFYYMNFIIGPRAQNKKYI